MKILSLNCGSSSAKYMLFNWKEQEIMAKGLVERVGIGGSFIVHEAVGHDKVKIEHDCPDHSEAIKLILKMLTHEDYGVIEDMSEVAAVGHRVVHGGERFARSVVIDDEVIAAFKRLQDLAPLHNPPNILGIEAARKVLPGVPQMAIMDTAWHQTMKPAQFLYAVPYSWYEKYKIRRYGFHGTSLLYVAKRAAVLLGKNAADCNLITLHIGNGVSANAVKGGVSFDTSMGFTPLEGLIMGTRAGDHDAALDFYVMQKEGIGYKEIDRILNEESGILGITGKYCDRRDVLEAAARGDERAQLAFEMETYRIKKYIGAYMAALGRVDALVWTAGVGEMSPEIRAGAMENLEHLGIKFDPVKNAAAKTRNAESDISAADSKVKIFVIPTDEELVLTEDVVALLEGRYENNGGFKYSFEDPAYENKMRSKAFARECLKYPERSLAAVKVSTPEMAGSH